MWSSINRCRRARTPPSLSENKMSQKLQRLWATKNKNDEWWSSFVTSPLAIAVNFVVVDWKWLTPNLLTLFSFMTAIAATVLIVIGGQIELFVAAVLIHVSHVMDCMDGQMARYRKIASRWGGFFDKMTDQVQVSLWFWRDLLCRVCTDRQHRANSLSFHRRRLLFAPWIHQVCHYLY